MYIISFGSDFIDFWVSFNAFVIMYIISDFGILLYLLANTVTARSKHEPSSPARTLGSWVRIPLEAWMSVCVYCVFALSCVGSGFATDWSPVQGVLLTVYRIKKVKSGLGPKGYRSIERERVHIFCVEWTHSHIFIILHK
jgi:hypothetical protein